MLVIDGVSRDRTVEIVKSFGSDAVRVFCERDSGIYDAMNKGLRWFSGDAVGFLGSDDTFHSPSVSRVACGSASGRRRRLRQSARCEGSSEQTSPEDVQARPLSPTRVSARLDAAPPDILCAAPCGRRSRAVRYPIQNWRGLRLCPSHDGIARFSSSLHPQDPRRFSSWRGQLKRFLSLHSCSQSRSIGCASPPARHRLCRRGFFPEARKKLHANSLALMTSGSSELWGERRSAFL